MRNLKKVLALVLALVMVIGLMSVASAKTTFDDVGSVTAKYSEAVQVLGGLDVFQGKNTPGNFAPKDTITRAEVAAIIYRLATDKDSQNSIYASGTDFADVKADDWFSGYVCYCYNAQYMIGDKTNFYPSMQVTDYQALAMILRAIGFRENNDFQGAGWEIRAASTARELGILKNVSEAELVGPASRELVAEILFQAAIVPQVKYTSINGYTQYKDTLISADSTKNDSLAWEVFKLAKTPLTTIDDWGRPGNFWYLEKADVAYADAEYTAGTDTLVAAVAMTPAVDTYEAMHECDVAHALGLDDPTDFSLFVNGAAAVTDTYRIEPTDTHTAVGMQGRHTQVFYDEVLNVARVVMVDTMLAQVANKSDAILDAAGHVVTPAKLTLVVYDHVDGALDAAIDAKAGAEISQGGDMTGAYTPLKTSEAYRTVVLKNGATNWDGYEKYEYILVNTWTRAGNPAPDNPICEDVTVPVDGDGEKDATHGSGRDDGVNSAADGTTAIAGKLKEAAAYETDKIVYYADEVDYSKPYISSHWVLSKPTSSVGKQTVVYTGANKHTVEGTDYIDANTLFLDEANVDVKTDHTWYLDARGNLIGIVDVGGTSKYGVITKIWWGGNFEDGSGYAKANVTYSDGTTGTAEAINKFVVNIKNASAAGDPADANSMMSYGSADPAFNTTVGELSIVSADYAAKALGPDDLQATYAADPDAAGAKAEGNLAVSISTEGNAAADDVWGITSEKGDDVADGDGVGLGNLWKFTVGADGKVTATEVAGSFLDDAVATADPGVGLAGLSVGTVAGDSGNSKEFARHFNIQTGDNSTDDLTSIITKGVPYAAIGGDRTGGTLHDDYETVLFDASTEFMVLNTATGAVATYKGINNLPGNLTIAATSEVDWVENASGVVSKLYCAGTFSGQITHNLFYFLSGTSWNDATKSGTVTGYLDGVATTATIVNEDLLKAMKAQSGKRTGENAFVNPGSLYAVMMDSGVIINAFMTAADADFTNVDTGDLLAIVREGVGNNGTDVQLSSLYTNTGGTDAGAFKFKANGGGNEYVTADTSVAWFDGTDVNGDATMSISTDGTVLTVKDYDSAWDGTTAGVNSTSPVDFYLLGTSKIVGEAYLNNESLKGCYVTIVYGTGSGLNVVDQIYITPYNLTGGEAYGVGAAGLVYGTSSDGGTTFGTPKAIGDVMTYDTALHAADGVIPTFRHTLPKLAEQAVAVGIPGDNNTTTGIYSSADAAAAAAGTLKDTDGLVMISAPVDGYVLLKDDDGTGGFVIIRIIVD